MIKNNQPQEIRDRLLVIYTTEAVKCKLKDMLEKLDPTAGPLSYVCDPTFASEEKLIKRFAHDLGIMLGIYENK